LVRKSAKNGVLRPLKRPSHEYKLIENQEDMAKSICDFFFTKKILSLDTETTSTNAIDAELVGLSFAVEGKEAYYVAVPG
jgi:DNA polymerase-1